jgi:hypothetical protein
MFFEILQKRPGVGKMLNAECKMKTRAEDDGWKLLTDINGSFK